MFYDLNNSEKLTFATRVAKGKELNKFKMIDKIVLDPRDSSSIEGLSNANFDFIEYKNRLIMTYSVGNQGDYAKLKVTYYDGNEEAFFEELND